MTDWWDGITKGGSIWREYMADMGGKLGNQTIALFEFYKLLKQIIILIIHFKKTNYKFAYVQCICF
jgi:hypothetical protein